MAASRLPRTPVVEKLAIAAAIALGAAALWLAADLDAPSYATIRAAARVGVVVVALVALAVAIWRIRRTRGRVWAYGAVAMFWGAALLATAVGALQFELRRARVLATEADAARALGGRFIVGYRHASEVEPLVRRGLIAGVFLTRRNVEGREVAEVRAEIDRLRALSRSAGRELIVAADQEGGPVAHLSPPLPHHPSLARLAELPAAERPAAARRQGAEMGAALAALGVTLDLAPVVDLRAGLPRDAAPRTAQIEARAISADPDVVSDIALAFARGLAEHGVGAVAKHFPGLGRVPTDTHRISARIDAPLAELEARDLAPFRALATEELAPAPMVMLGHVVVTALDSENLASQSRRSVELIRAWSPRARIMTDDMAMTPVLERDACAGTARALAAGVDYVLVSWDGAMFYPLFDCAAQALRRGAVALR